MRSPRSREELRKIYKSYEGHKIGILKIIGVSSKRYCGGQIAFDAICDCGKNVHVAFFNLEKGRVKSCGCWKKSEARTEKTFLSNFEKTDGCWNWKGKINPYNGYGYMPKKSAHRFSYEYYKNKIPGDKMICHTCNNKLCVNPDHMYLGTAHTNCQDAIKDGVYKKRSLSSKRHVKKAVL